MRRRGKGEGSIRLRADGRWEATLTLATMGGKRRRKSYFGKTRADAARKLTAGLKAQADSLPLPSERLTVKVYLNQWLESKRDTWRTAVTNFALGQIGGLNERAMTRDLSWGVPVPLDDPDAKGKVLYVWFDAPIGYVSFTAKLCEQLGEGW